MYVPQFIQVVKDSDPVVDAPVAAACSARLSPDIPLDSWQRGGRRVLAQVWTTPASTSDKAETQVIGNDPVAGWRVRPALSPQGEVVIIHPFLGYEVHLSVNNFLKYASLGWDTLALSLCYKDRASGVSTSVCTQEEAQAYAASFDTRALPELLIVSPEDAILKLTPGDIVSAYFLPDAEQLTYITTMEGAVRFLSRRTGKPVFFTRKELLVKHGEVSDDSHLGTLKTLLTEQYARTHVSRHMDDAPITPDSKDWWTDMTLPYLSALMSVCDGLHLDIAHKHILKEGEWPLFVAEQEQYLQLLKGKKGYTVRCTRGTKKYTGEDPVAKPFEEAVEHFIRVLYSVSQYKSSKNLICNSGGVFMKKQSEWEDYVEHVEAQLARFEF